MNIVVYLSNVKMSHTAAGHGSIMNVVICYWCNWFICPIMLETVVSPFYCVVQYAAHQRAVLRRNNEQTSPRSTAGGALFTVPACNPWDRWATEKVEKCPKFRRIMVNQVKLYIENAIFVQIKNSHNRIVGNNSNNNRRRRRTVCIIMVVLDIIMISKLIIITFFQSSYFMDGWHKSANYIIFEMEKY